MLLALSAVLAVTLSFAPPAAPARSRGRLDAARIDALLTSPTRRIRAVEPAVASLLAAGLHRSYTFGQLVETIEASDLIVYIVMESELPNTLAGRLMIVPGPHEQRYLRIQVATHGTDEDAIATIAHELRHAVEVAEFPDVRDEPALAALYRRIGHSAGGPHQFDTLAARDTGRAVRNELG